MADKFNAKHHKLADLDYRNAQATNAAQQAAGLPRFHFKFDVNGLGQPGGSYKVTEGLLAKYGPGRVRDTPIAEAGMIGVGVGAAIAGARPVVEILYVDFAMLGMDMIVNQAAKFRLMTGGEGRVPFIMRTQGGAGGGVAAHAVYPCRCEGLAEIRPAPRGPGDVP